VPPDHPEKLPLINPGDAGDEKLAWEQEGDEQFVF